MSAAAASANVQSPGPTSPQTTRVSAPDWHIGDTPSIAIQHPIEPVVSQPALGARVHNQGAREPASVRVLVSPVDLSQRGISITPSRAFSGSDMRM